VIRRIRVLRLPAWLSTSSGLAHTASTSLVQEQPTSSSNSINAFHHYSTQMPIVRPIVISGPSGGGKSTILAKAMKDYPDAFAFSVSRMPSEKAAMP
jgi:hypothetical protein